MASIPVFIDTVTGRLRRSESDSTQVALRAFAYGDILSLALRFVTADALTTSTVLPATSTLAVTLKDTPGNTTALASATAFSLASEIATIALSLTGSALAALFPSGSERRQLAASLEIKITNEAGTNTDSFRIPVAIEAPLATVG